MGLHTTFSSMVACRLLIFSIMGFIPATSIAAAAGGYSHSPPSPRISVVPMILLDDQWWNPSSSFTISPVTTQLSLLYIITDWSTSLYIIPRVRTVAPIFANTLVIVSTASVLPSGSDTPLNNRCCYIQSSAKVREVIRRYQGLCIDLEQEPNFLQSEM